MEQLSGNQASIYSLFVEEENRTLFDKFLFENNSTFISELQDIITRLNTMAHKTGAREQYFKLAEGKPGDLVCALYDKPKSNLRLYCIRFGSSLIILGGGGKKPKSIRALQHDTELYSEQKIMVNLSAEIFKRRRDKEIWFTNNYKDLEGDLAFEF